MVKISSIFVAFLENLNFITLVYEQIQIQSMYNVHTIIVSGKGVFINEGKKATVLSGMIIIVLLQFKVIIWFHAWYSPASCVNWKTLGKGVCLYNSSFVN